MQIIFNQLKLFGYHGFFEEEKILGNYFILNVIIDIDDLKKVDDINDIVDYSQLFRVIQTTFNDKVDALEILCKNISSALYKAFPQITKICIDVCKEKIFITGFEGNVSVKLTTIRNDK